MNNEYLKTVISPFRYYKGEIINNARAINLKTEQIKIWKNKKIINNDI